MARVLITGFKPLPGVAADASSDAVRILADTWHGADEIIARRLTPSFEEAPRRLRASIARHLPDAVIVVAAGSDSDEVVIERLAVNLDDAAEPDATGNQPVDRSIVPGAEAALWTTLPARAILDGLRAHAIPTRLSMSAGTGVANHVFYSLQRELAEWGVPSGLVRVPRAEGLGAFPVEVSAEALRVVVAVTLASLDGRELPKAPSIPTTLDEPPERDGYDPDATQPYLIAISEPIAGSRPVPDPPPPPEPPEPPEPPAMIAPTPHVTPTLAAAASATPAGAAHHEQMAQLPQTAPAPTPEGMVEDDLPQSPPWPPTAAEADLVAAPSDQSAPDPRSNPDAGGKPEPQTRPLTWEEIITGGGK